MRRDPVQGMINLHDPDARCVRRPLLVAHRGGVIAPDAPENSLAAIRLAAAHGYDMVELDVRQAKDGVPVLFHGRGARGSLFVDCGVERFVEELTRDELGKLPYLASEENIATLADALALCASLGLGVMLDIKGSACAEPPLRRVADLLRAHDLGPATVTISRESLVRECLAGQSMFPLSDEDVQRALYGEVADLTGQFWFGWAAHLPSAAVALLQRGGAIIIVSINTFHYPSHARDALARQDIRRLQAASVDGFQIDSVYEDCFS
jgi:hypothetical protein